MDIGIDIGASSTKIVAFHGNRIILREIVQEKKVERLLDFIKSKLSSGKPDNKELFITGGNSLKLKELKERFVDEICAIGYGGCFLAHRKKGLIVNSGTGICVVYYDKKAEHLGGSGIGGGTLLGLAELIFKEKDFLEIEKIASKGDLSLVDLSVEDIIGGGIGIIPGSATACHFGKLRAEKKEDVAMGLFNMVAQNIAVLGVMNSNFKREDEIIFTGRLVRSEIIRRKIHEICSFFSKNAIFPKDCEFSSSIGAVMHSRCEN